MDWVEVELRAEWREVEWDFVMELERGKERPIGGGSPFAGAWPIEGERLCSSMEAAGLRLGDAMRSEGGGRIWCPWLCQ